MLTKQTSDKTMQERFETERLLLRPFSLKDSSDVFEYASDEKTVEYLTWYAHKNIDESKKIVQTIYIPTNVYCIELKIEHKCIGAFEPRIFPNKASFGYVLNKKYWNKGYMSEVLTKMIDVFFEDPRCMTVFGIHFLGNEASGAVMKKCGMEMCGIQKEKVHIKGKTFESILYQLYRKNWDTLCHQARKNKNTLSL